MCKLCTGPESYEYSNRSERSRGNEYLRAVVSAGWGDTAERGVLEQEGCPFLSESLSRHITLLVTHANRGNQLYPGASTGATLSDKVLRQIPRYICRKHRGVPADSKTAPTWGDSDVGLISSYHIICQLLIRHDVGCGGKLCEMLIIVTHHLLSKR